MHDLKNTDIYLLDQILKDKISKDYKILDAGCGTGRNMHYFIKNGYNISGLDVNENHIKILQKTYNKHQFSIATIDKVPFKESSFDYIICNAVLHFAKTKEHFFEMFNELFRVLKTNGTLFIRMTSNFGIENKVIEIENGVYKIPDGSNRFLLTETILKQLKNTYSFHFDEPLKTVNVNNIRCMSTLILKK